MLAGTSSLFIFEGVTLPSLMKKRFAITTHIMSVVCRAYYWHTVRLLSRNPRDRRVNMRETLSTSLLILHSMPEGVTTLLTVACRSRSKWPSSGPQSLGL